MPLLVDQMGREVNVPDRPQRIISLVPSQTELLYDLGLTTEVVGVTKFCIHPENWRKEKTVVGGTKQVHFDIIEELQPDLIIGNKEENEEGFIKELQSKYPVWMSDIESLSDALDMIEAIGEITCKIKEAEALVVNILSEFSELEAVTQLKKAVYLIWKKPYMAAGNQTFIQEMLEQAGYENLVKDVRYPELSKKRLVELQPEVLLLSSEPYPFKDKHIQELKEVLPNTDIRLVDGEMFSWYGSRLLKAPGYFKSLRG
ncbi:ABC transporter substrate-binding protein [Roseivirga sp.]|uniref:ABC transporter substrate-binding protein n=1 Tax=Roseivirga sp. TaxID=1964215 RepID=UPI003B5191E3